MYKLGSKEEYVNGNMQHYHKINNWLLCLAEAVDWLKRAKQHAPGKPEYKDLIALLRLVDSLRVKAASSWLNAENAMIDAQGYMWEHFKLQEREEE